MKNRTEKDNDIWERVINTFAIIFMVGFLGYIALHTKFRVLIIENATERTQKVRVKACGENVWVQLDPEKSRRLYLGACSDVEVDHSRRLFYWVEMDDSQPFRVRLVPYNNRGKQ